jgi:hypothetical protein
LHAWPTKETHDEEDHRQLTLMSSVKHRTHDWDVLHARQCEVD